VYLSDVFVIVHVRCVRVRAAAHAVCCRCSSVDDMVVGTLVLGLFVRLWWYSSVATAVRGCVAGRCTVGWDSGDVAVAAVRVAASWLGDVVVVAAVRLSRGWH